MEMEMENNIVTYFRFGQFQILHIHPGHTHILSAMTSAEPSQRRLRLLGDIHAEKLALHVRISLDPGLNGERVSYRSNKEKVTKIKITATIEHLSPPERIAQQQSVHTFS
jgi:hypothetical protein